MKGLVAIVLQSVTVVVAKSNISMKRQFQLFSTCIAASFLVFTCACSAAGGETSSIVPEPTLSSLLEDVLEEPEAVYFALDTEGDLLQGEAIPHNILVVKTTEELIATFERLPKTKMLFLEPKSLETMDSDLLQNYYNEGVMVVALNTPVRELGSRLGVYTEMQDLDMSSIPGGFVVFSAHQLVQDTEQGTSNTWMLSDYFASFADALSALAASVDYNTE